MRRSTGFRIRFVIAHHSSVTYCFTVRDMAEVTASYDLFKTLFSSRVEKSRDQLVLVLPSQWRIQDFPVGDANPSGWGAKL